MIQNFIFFFQKLNNIEWNMNEWERGQLVESWQSEFSPKIKDLAKQKAQKAY